MKKLVPTEAEQKLLSLLWESGPLSIMQITEKVQSETGWSKQAVISFLKRMELKGFVTYEQKGRTKYYTPLCSKSSFIRKERNNFLQSYYQGKLGLMVSAMAEEEALSKEDIEDLRALLDKLSTDGDQDFQEEV